MQTSSVAQEPDLPCLRLGSPRIRVDVQAEPKSFIGAKNTQGQPFDLPFDRDTAIQKRYRIASIGMEAGWRVDQLRISYENLESHESQAMIVHGGNKGNNLGDIQLGPGKKISEIYSEYGTSIDRLKIDADQRVLENFGTKGDRQHPVHWQYGPNQIALGFSGRSDDNPAGALYALQAIVATFQKIDWEPIDGQDS